MTEEEIRKDECERVLKCIKKWLDIKNEHLKCKCNAWTKGPQCTQPEATTAADVDHSSLLRRLLKGEGYYNVPAPRAYSYPRYEVLEGSRVENVEVGFWSLPLREIRDAQGIQQPTVVIDQAIYLIVETHSPDDMLIEWPETKMRFRLWKEMVEGKTPWQTKNDPDQRIWVLQKKDPIPVKKHFI